MRIEKRDSMVERRILTSLITDPVVLARISAKWDKQLFKARWSNLIAGWCIRYFNKYGKAPGRHIVGLFESWASEAKEKETVSLVERFLEGMSEDYRVAKKERNSDYVIDMAGEYFNKIRLSRLAEELQGDVDGGDLANALKRVNTFGKVEMGGGNGVDVFSDKAAIQRAFATKGKPLITYPGALENFFEDMFERDSFISFEGMEKRGKTFWLMDVAWRSMMQGNNTVFFAVGDMSESQMMMRFMIRAAKRPYKPGLVKYPIGITHEPERTRATVQFEERNFKRKLEYDVAWKACQRIVARKGNEARLKLSCHPNSSINVQGLNAIIQGWDRTGWTPSVIVIDYADILAPPAGTVESRDQINATWKELRRMSQAYHCCVVTATQTDAKSYNTDTISMANFSEDKRKRAHVTASVGINASGPEQEHGIQRLNFVVRRESRFISSECVHVAGCLDIANPAILSVF